MTTISATLVNELRQRTGRPMMECKSALTEAGGDLDKAVEILRKRAPVAKADRVTGEGRIATFIDADKKIAGIVEVLCESAPVAKSEQFVALADALAKQVALGRAESVDALLAEPLAGDPGKTVKERIGEVFALIREKMQPNRFARLSGGTFGSYIHHDGTVGVLLEVSGGSADPQVLRDVCMHIAAVNPPYALREQVPADVLAKEKEIVQAQIAADPENAGKPANIIEKMAEGKLRKLFFGANVLTEQEFVKDPSKTVGKLLDAAGLKVVRFVRYKVGASA
jgi:elongation factor Ts